MRKKIPPVVKTPLHNSNERKAIEYLLESSPNAERVRTRLKQKERKEFLAKIAANFPTADAALKTKKEQAAILGVWGTDRSTRKWVKRYFRRARDIVFGAYKFKTVYGDRHRKRHLNYEEYINSHLWGARKSRYYREHGRKCAACGSAEHIQLHHMVYTARDGTEPDKNLVALCDYHHTEFHVLHGSSGNMKELTLVYVEEVRSGIPREAMSLVQ